MHARGQWGLLGGSSHHEQSNMKPKSSKLAKLAQSSKGAFERKGIHRQKQDPGTFESVSRLSSLSLSSRPQLQRTKPPLVKDIVPATEPKVEASPSDPMHHPIESENRNASTDLRAADLLADPSTLADSLFRIWVAPENTPDSLLRIYADPYLLTVSDQAQLQKAFSSASPDDVVRSAQSKDCVVRNMSLLARHSNGAHRQPEAT